MSKDTQSDNLFSEQSLAIIIGAALQWASWSIFHESSYIHTWNEPVPYLLTWGVVNCFSITIGALVGSFLALKLHKKTGTEIILIPMIIQVLMCLLFYSTLVKPHASLGSQYMQAFSDFLLTAAAVFVLMKIVIAFYDKTNHFVRDLALVAGLSWLLAYGFFAIIGYMLSPITIMVFHLAVITLATWLLLKPFRRKPVVETSSEETPESTLNSERSLSLSCPLVVLFIAYCIVCGIFHRLHGAIPADQIPRAIAFFVGSIFAAVLFYLTVSNKSTIKTIWSNITRCIFPTLMISCILMPLLFGVFSFPVFIFSEFSVSYFMLLTLFTVYYLTKTAHLNLGILLPQTAIVWYASTIIGEIIGTIIRRFATFDATFFSWFMAIIFIALVIVTFEIPVMKNSKTLWGLLDDLTPQALFDDRIHKASLRLADEFGLTSRESEVLELLAHNKRADEIHNELILSITTVRTYTQHIYKKLGVHSHGELQALIKEYTN